MSLHHHANVSGPHWGGPFPALHLWPLQDTFAMKMIHLPPGQRIKIGRQTNNKTVPGERNAYFDSKVLSRTHAEIWEQDKRIYIKDVKSSNGTFVNAERLSQEGVESAPYELKSEDIVEFGIDIVSDDNRTIVHHKVAAKVYCCFSQDDAALSSRELSLFAQDNRGGPRRPAAPASTQQHSQIGPLVMSAGGKGSALSFDLVLHKLQAELDKSKETGAELQTLATAMTDIQDTLGGGLPPNMNGSASHLIPPQYRVTSAEARAALSSPHGPQAAAFISLQNQLTETQQSLAGHLDKIAHLEDQLKQQDSLRHELSTIRSQMDETRRELNLLLAGARGRQPRLGRDDQDDESDDDDDAKSVMTVMESDEAQQRVQTVRRETPNSSIEGEADLESDSQTTQLQAQVHTLSAEIAQAVELSRSLQSQHSEALSAIQVLTEKVNSLENGIVGRIADAVSQSETKWQSWRTNAEDAWKRDRESWDSERERLRGVVKEWEAASRRIDDNRLRGVNGHAGEQAHHDLDNDWDHSDPDGLGSPGDSPRKPKKRRHSQKATLALAALQSISEPGGSATPRPSIQDLKAIVRDKGQAQSGSSELDSRSDAPRTKESTTADTNRSIPNSASQSRADNTVGSRATTTLQPFPLVTMFVVVVAAGAMYYKQREP